MLEHSDKIITSREQAAQVKADMKLADAVPKRWRAHTAFTSGLAVDFANTPPAQGAGEAVFSVRDDGKVDVFLFV